jgi:hypothetical protein
VKGVPGKYAKLAKRVEELESRVCPPKERKCLTCIVAEGEDEKPAMARALEEHLRAYPQDPKGVADYQWIVCIIVTPAPRSAGWSDAQQVTDSNVLGTQGADKPRE